MSSAQSKMRTNGMFFRNFDSKHHQELQKLQAQKAKILEKQKELLKIKDSKSRKSDLPNGEADNEINAEDKEHVVDANDNVADSGKLVIHSAYNEGTVSDNLELQANATLVNQEQGVKEAKEMSKTVKSGKSNRKEQFQSIYADLKAARELQTKAVAEAENPKVSTTKNKSKDPLTNKQTESGASNTSVNQHKDQTKGTSKTSEDKGKEKVKIASVKGDKHVAINGLSNEQSSKAVIKKSPSGQMVKEYSIIAKLNKDALKRETELVDNENKSDTYAKTNMLKHGPEKTNLSASMAGLLSTRTEAYAVVDLEANKTLVDTLNGNIGNTGTLSLGRIRDSKNLDNANTAVGETSIDTKIGTMDYRDIVHNYRQHSKMTRSAGYNGDIDTSTSSIEPDYMECGYLDAYISSKLTLQNKDRLIITEEQLSSLHAVTSSSSG
ncbi:hypothetical protein DPMN_040891 [Dreissena polymorpha]|uniref:Uncharacterized protein n=1 Tax=Dreissena polymorpha TaxID=45954 RepID=A0A9D4CYE5_DREPO|nr:hypothetical protein DPMN_040891 [Dreissena polymorpha]